MGTRPQDLRVFHEGVAGLPSWLLGVLLGVVGSLGVACVFLVAERLLPGEGVARERRRTGESRRREEFREYLDAIDEPYAENHAVAGQRVAFYLPTRDVAITFDPRAYYRIDRTETEPVLVEHELPGPVLGDRLPFETPTLDAGIPTRDAIDPTGAAFAELGVPVGASAAEVTRAYRHRIKEVHPDQGGDEDAFRRVREAYATARKHAD